MKHKQSSFVFILITFLAGFIFLNYEVAWNRYLSLILGTTVKAATLILSTFMAGFGAGAVILGKKADKTRNINLLLSSLFAGIGTFSILNYFLIGNLAEFIRTMSLSPQLTDLLIHSGSVLLLLIPSFIMGGIIPVISKIIINSDDKIAEKLGRIYAFETLGSTIGGLITGFVLLRYAGQFYSLLTVSVLSFLSGGYIFFSKRFKVSLPIKKEHFSNNKNNKPDESKTAKYATFIVGFALLSMQILWIRVFRIYFANTAYTFALIASFVILGYYLGSSYYKKKGELYKDNNRLMLKTLLLLSFALTLSLPLLYFFPNLFMFPFEKQIANHFFRLLIVPSLASIIIILPPAIISGFAFPLACKMNTSNSQSVSSNVGKIMMINTLGAALGPVIAAFVLIPAFGVGKSIFILVLFLLGITFFTFKKFKDKKYAFTKKIIIGKAALLLLLLIAMKEIQFLPPSLIKFDKKVLAYKETREGTVIVANEKKKGVFGKTSFVNNSAVIGSNFDALKAVKMVGHIPFFAGLKCNNALVIGFGIGVTTSAIASHKEVKHIDCVEMVPGLVEAASHYKDLNFRVYKDKRLHIIPGDGRYYLQTSNKKYDLISCDPTHPVLGSGNLYTQDYFRQCYEHLTPQGMVSQYLPLHKLRLEDLLGIIKSFDSVFPESYLWLGQYHAILIGRKTARKIDFNTWQKKVYTSAKDEFFWFEPYHIAASLIYDKKKIEEITKKNKINTDDLSYTEFFDFDCFNAENLTANLTYLSSTRTQVDDVLEGIEKKYRMDKFTEGNIKMTESLYYMLQNKPKSALNYLREAIKVNPENREYPFLLKLYYGYNY